MRNLYKYIDFIKEELRIDKMNSEDLERIKIDLLKRIDEYKVFILNNIEYDLRTNKIIYKEFEEINVDLIITELENEFGDEVIEDLNIDTLLRKVNQLLELKRRDTKKNIRKQFDNFIKTIDQRISVIKTGEQGEHFDEFEGEGSILTRKEYETEKYQIQVELMKLQEWVITNKKRVAIVFEGRDSAGKGSTIKRFIEYLNPKGFRVVALGVPTPEEKENWFARYEAQMPKEGEIVFFDRSWYNRAVVEPAMGYCTEEQYKEFMDNVVKWEEKMIRRQDLHLIKFWFSITKEKQLKRFDLRQQSPLKYWKFSPNDAKVVDKWDVIGKYKNQMFNVTSSRRSPWVIINSNDKKIGRLNAMRYVLSVIPYDDKNRSICQYYPEVVSVLK
jgi:polyphosphate kinase 2